MAIACAAGVSAGADKNAPPGLPLAAFWSVELSADASVSPVRDGDRVFVALKSAHLTARAVADGALLWRIPKDITVPMAVDGGLLFVAAGEAVEALRGQDGANVWTVPRLKAVVPLVAGAGWLIAVTETEIVAIRSKDGQVIWRHAAGGVHLPPAIDGEHLYSGADDGRVLALTLASGAVVWEHYLQGGVSTIAARAGRVYAGAGDKQFYCLNGRRSGHEEWAYRIGSLMSGNIAVDDDRVYFTGLDNVVHALDRSNGNQRWTSALRRRPIAGAFVADHIVFVPAAAPQLFIMYDRDGRSSGTIELPGEILRDIPPDIHMTPQGVNAFVVTGGLANNSQLTYIAPAGESTLVPMSELTTMPGVPFLTDPELQSIGRVMGWLILTDPQLRPVSEMGFPLVLQDPPLEPFRTPPGLQLRPLSPVLPIRREG